MKLNRCVKAKLIISEHDMIIMKGKKAFRMCSCKYLMQFESV